VPGYKGIVGNKTANLLSKPGADTPLVGPECTCSIYDGTVRGALRDWRSIKHLVMQSSLFWDLH